MLFVPLPALPISNIPAAGTGQHAVTPTMPFQPNCPFHNLGMMIKPSVEGALLVPCLAHLSIYTIDLLVIDCGRYPRSLPFTMAASNQGETSSFSP